jgi:hypothetical protein
MTEEFKRMQKLAGIILEETTPNNNKPAASTDPQADKGAEIGLKQALATLKSSVSSIQTSPKDKELQEGAALTLGLIAGAPGLISALGKGVNVVSSVFQKDKKQGTVVGNALKKWGHSLEHTYMDAIGAMLKKAFPSKYSNQDVHDKKSELHKAAHGLYAAVLAAAAISSGMGATEAHSTVMQGLESGLSAFKSSEVVDLAKKIAAV